MAEPLMAFDRAELDKSIPARFDKIVRSHAARVAIGGDRPWTYGDVERRANQLARAILKRTRPGRGCVAYLVGHSPDMVICSLAAVKAAKAFLCIHPGTPLKAQRDIIGDAAPDLLLADAVHAAAARQLVDDDRRVLLLEDVDANYSGDALHVPIEPSDPAAIFYTSGSTGRPKGVVKSHRTVLHRAWLCTRYDGVGPTDRQSLLTYCSFASSEADVFGALLNGATLELYDAASRGLGDLGAWLDERRITLLHPPVMLFRKYLEMIEGTGLHPSVRLVALAGQTVIASDIEQWRRHFATSCALRHRFSSTEAGHIAVASVAPGEMPAPGIVPAPRAVSDKSILVVDDEGQLVEQGSVGELVVRSAFLADGYWRQEAETARYYHTDPDFPAQQLFHTGDIGRLLSDDSFEFIGRRDDQVKIRGYRVETREIEHAFMLLQTVNEAAVITELRQGVHSLAAFVVMKQGAMFQTDALRAGLRSILPQWKIPGRIYTIESLPLTPTGKIDKPLLQQYLKARNGPLVTSQAAHSSDKKPDGPIAKLIKTWKGLFDRGRIR